VGDWRVDPAAGRLTREKETATLEPKVMDLLVLLAARPNEVFSKDDIFSALWPGVTVGEDTLARAVSKLRKALGDASKAPRYVETIPKRGYRLIAAVNHHNDATQAASPKAQPLFRRRPLFAAGGLLAFAALIVALLFVSNSGERTTDPRDATKLTARADDFYMRYTNGRSLKRLPMRRRKPGSPTPLFNGWFVGRTLQTSLQAAPQVSARLLMRD